MAAHGVAGGNGWLARTPTCSSPGLLGLPGHAEGVACDGCPPLSRLFEQYADGGGELLVCPICFTARKLDESQLLGNARLAGATPLWEWIGEGATVFSY